MTTTDLAVFDRALRAATRAASVHNTQPWRFVVAPPHVELYLDRERVLAVADPDAREARLSCGAALLNLRIALQAEDRGMVVDLLPDAARPDLLARVRVAGARPATPEVRSLAAAIERRTTNRRPFTDRPVPAPHRAALLRAAAVEGAQLVLLDTPVALEEFATWLRRADHLQEEDPAFQQELLSWTTGGSARPDGVPRTAGGPRPIGTSLLKLREFPAPAAAEREFEQEPLVATVAGLSVSFLSQPVEVPYTRATMRTLLDGRHPQTALRIGYGHQSAPTPRRPVAAVTGLSPPENPEKELLR